MANTQNYPKLTIQIEGKNKITDIYNVESFLPLKKIETESVIDVADGWVSIFANSVLPVRKVIVEAPYYDSALEAEYTVDLKVIYNHPISGNLEKVESIEGLNIKSYPETYGARIVDVQVSTSSAEGTTRTIKSSIYGWE